MYIYIAKTNIPLSFIRRIFEAEILEVEGSNDDATSFYCFHVRGSSFLWHQVRCMMAILFHVGKGKEDVGVVQSMLDPSNIFGSDGSRLGRPMFAMASEIPLVLAECGYDDGWYDHSPSSLLTLTY